jgi:hypothetical protein
MSEAHRTTRIFCNGAKPAGRRKPKGAVHLDYRGAEAKVKLHLPAFVREVNHLPDRVLDLLEIAAYVFAADRSVHRGDKDALEYHTWSRSLHLTIKVRDHAFWQRKTVQEKLAAALVFMSGDRFYDFAFQPGHSTPATGLFDRQGLSILPPESGTKIAMFSGGLDSLGGVVDALADPAIRPCLISHQSGQTGTVRTQNQMFKALDDRYPKRLSHYRFRCGLQGVKAEEETQRTRAFLYTSTAFALASALNLNEITAYENGVTAINFPRRGDLLNARASRTTHPRTIALMEAFLSEVLGSTFRVETPFLWKTKADVLRLLDEHGASDLIASAVSCSKTFQNLGQAPQCGGCSQCVDRRFAAYAAGMDDRDHSGLYALDFLTEVVADTSVRTTVVDYVRQARDFADWNVDHFQTKHLNELADVVGYTGLGEEETVEATYGLCRRHGLDVSQAVRRMRERHDDPMQPLPAGSFLRIISDREYLNEAKSDYAGLLGRLGALPTGDEHATAYERLVREVMVAVFEPDLAFTQAQERTDGGRKRIDLIFRNTSEQGFFSTLRDAHQKYCPWIPVECKNYSNDLANPEYSQLKDRLGDGRPEVGLIVCRKNVDAQAVLKQCQDRSRGSRGGIIMLVLEDADLMHLLTLRARGQVPAVVAYLDDKLRPVLFRT